MVLLDSSGGAGMVFFVMRGFIGSFRGARGPEGVPAGRSRGPGGRDLITSGRAFFAFEGRFIVFFVLRALWGLWRRQGAPRDRNREPAGVHEKRSGGPSGTPGCLLGAF